MFGDKRRVMLGGTIVAVVGLAVWLQMSPAAPAASTTAPAARPRAGRGDVAPAPGEPLRRVKLDALAASAGREEPGDTSRNPFRFQPKAVPAPPRPVGPAPRPDVQGPAMPSAPPGPPPPPPIPLKFIGLVERANGVKWAVLSDGRVTLHGREGDIIDGRYRIVKIGTESIELTYADGRGRQTVRLTGQ